ncbi:MAG TPA: hypothetical protein VFU31_10290 [Candidatus Binatia bacterium]|nr:hypothetical protein [Candidatus Binatia bacterium]
MIVVNYLHEFNYRAFQDGRFPVLQLQVCDPDNLENKIDVDAYLDSGAQKSLFNGFLITSLGITLINDKTQRYNTTAGNFIEAYLHHIQLNLPGIGAFNLEIGFSSISIRRNLLGRDFFNLTQIGFRENQLKYYLTPTP